jgi:aryl-alcohol dehydrogenase-like predicted oxidoreductase
LTEAAGESDLQPRLFEVEFAQDPIHHLVRELPVASHPQQGLALRRQHELHHLLVGERAVLVAVVLDLAGAGRDASFDDLPEDDARRTMPRFQHDALRANLTIVGRVREIAEQARATPAQVALAWLVAQGRNVIPIPGTKTPMYLADNAGAADVELSATDLADLDALPAPQGSRY